MVTIHIILLVIAILFLVVGLIGTVAPVLPGPPLAWVGILLTYWIPFIPIPLWLIISTAVAAVIVTILDNILPVYMTKLSGGSKAGAWGCTLGLIFGFFIGPAGIIFCPFFGALIGELIHDNSNMARVFKAAFGAFMGFLLGTGLKLTTVILFIWIFIRFAIS